MRQSLFYVQYESKTEEVVTNYVSNALHHLDGEKIVDKSPETGKQRKVTVFNTEPQSKADLLNLWNKFYKVDKSPHQE